MLWFVLRSLGLFLLACAGVAGILDGAQTVAAEEIVTTPLGQTWYQLNAASLDGFQTWLARTLPSPWGERIWDVVIVSILRAPTFAVLAVLGTLLIVAGHRRRERRDPLALR